LLGEEKMKGWNFWGGKRALGTKVVGREVLKPFQKRTRIGGSHYGSLEGRKKLSRDEVCSVATRCEARGEAPHKKGPGLACLPWQGGE